MAAGFIACGGGESASRETSTASAPATATTSTTSTTSTTIAPPAAPIAAAASEVVAQLYKEHDAGRSPFFQTDSRAPIDRFFEPSLAELIWKDAVTAAGEVGALGADPLYDAQDTEIAGFTVGAGALTADGTARVEVTFTNLGEAQKLVYTLAQADGTWKIRDVAYADGRTLRSMLAAPQV